jgi:hypothetical protein
VFIIIVGCSTNSKNVIANNILYEMINDDKMFIYEQISLMDNIVKMHSKIKNIHKSLEKLYPITVINNDYFFVFDFNESEERYEFKLKMNTPMPILGNILAAFSLDFYYMKPSAIISNNILIDKNNYVFIFHEFVHCFQLENGEIDIRRNLNIEKQEMAKNNFNWEINYPFPYNSEYFVNRTIRLSNYFYNDDYENIMKYYRDMKVYLQETEFEYMIWQKWKEGFARYIENLIRKELGLQLNTNELIPPFDRVHFYEIGSKYIEYLLNNYNELDNCIIKLFEKMFIIE